MTLEQEVVKICQDLIRIPSVNFGDGKGDEKAVAEYVVASLAEVGIPAKIYESAPKSRKNKKMPQIHRFLKITILSLLRKVRFLKNATDCSRIITFLRCSRGRFA